MQTPNHLQDMKQYKIVIAGETGVGKTTLRLRYFGGKFTKSYIPTLGVDFSVMRKKVADGSFAEIQVWDMAGQMTFQSLRKRFFLGASSLFLVYDITDKTSFEKLGEWFEDFWVSYNNRKDVTLVLIGNKIDLGDPVISKEEMDGFWDKIRDEYPEFKGKTTSIYTSALNGFNVREVFEMTVQEISNIYNL